MLGYDSDMYLLFFGVTSEAVPSKTPTNEGLPTGVKFQQHRTSIFFRDLLARTAVLQKLRVDRASILLNGCFSR